MKKNIIGLFIFVLINSSNLSGQNIIWDHSEASSYDEVARSIININGGEFLVGGKATSNTAPINNHHGLQGNNDFWLYKLDSIGNMIWNKCYGGTQDEEIYSVIQTLDNGYCAVGLTYSQDFDVTGLHPTNPWWADSDIWIIKTDSFGNLVWQKCIGGTGREVGYYVEQTSDSGYMVIGETNSNDGDVFGFHGTPGLGSDIFLARLDKIGNLLWTKCYGSYDYDIGYVIKQTSDGGFLMGADVTSNSGDVSDYHGGANGTSDIWIAKLNANGAILWSKCYGGTDYDQIYQILFSAGNGFTICSMSSSNDGDISGQNGIGDFWLVQCDSIGAIQWQQCYGGSSYDDLYMAQRTIDGGVVMTGSTSSFDGICSGHRPGFYDYLVVKVDSIGNFQWSKCLGGSEDDYAYGLCSSPSGKIIVAGYTKSNDYDVSQYYGGKDSWVVALSDLNLGIPFLKNSISECLAQLNQNRVNIQFYSLVNEDLSISLHDLLGREIFYHRINCIAGKNKFEFPVNSINKGIYILKIVGKNGSNSLKLFAE